MSIFDSLFGGGKQVISPDADIMGQTTVDAASNSDAGFFTDLFSDQNFVRGLGEAGRAVSQGGSAGEVLGDFNTNLIRRRQTQKAAGDMRRQGEEERNLFRELLSDPSRFVGPKEDNTTADSINFTGDTATMKFSNAPQRQGFKRNPPLETMRRTPSYGGSDLPDFSNQSSRGEIDFAGLDPEDIGMLLKAEQQFGALNQDQAKMILQEKARREEVVRQNQIRQEELKALAEERLAKSMAAKREQVAQVEADKALQDRLDEREILKARLKDTTLTPEERENARLKNEKLQSEIAKLEAETGKIARTASTGLSPAEELNLDKFSAEQLSLITNPETDLTTATQLAEQENNRPGSGMVYYPITNPGTDEGWFWFDKPYEEVASAPIPKGLTFYGKPATGKEIIKRAAAANMTVPEYIEALNNVRR